MLNASRGPFWVAPCSSEICWGRLGVLGRDYQFVVTSSRRWSCWAYYTEPFTRFLCCEFLPAFLFARCRYVEVREMAETLLERLLRGAPGKGAAENAGDPAFAKKFPCMFELMTCAILPGGEVRKPSSLLVFTEDGSWKGCLTERELEVSLWCTQGSFQALLEGLEERLTVPQPDWRKRGVGPRGRK
jgi:hypothetical protein